MDIYSIGQTDRDDLSSEVCVLRERLEKNQTNANKIIEEKEAAVKELDRVLEKYDR